MIVLGESRLVGRDLQKFTKVVLVQICKNADNRSDRGVTIGCREMRWFVKEKRREEGERKGRLGEGR